MRLCDLAELARPAVPAMLRASRDEFQYVRVAATERASENRSGGFDECAGPVRQSADCGLGFHRGDGHGRVAVCRDGERCWWWC